MNGQTDTPTRDQRRVLEALVSDPHTQFARWMHARWRVTLGAKSLADVAAPTAQALIARGWVVQVRGFARGVYELAEAGREALARVCTG